MLLRPDPDTAVIDPFRQHKTLNINCFVHDPLTGESYSPRPPLRRQEGRGVPALAPASPTPATSGPRPSSSSSTTCASARPRTPAMYQVDSVEATWNTGRDEQPNLGYKPRVQGGLLPGPADGPLPGPPLGDGAGARCDLGIEVEVQHHEVGTAGQAEIDMRFDSLLRHGRPAHALQVRRQERGVGRTARRPRSCRSRSSRTTVRACTCTSRCGRAASRCSTTRRATPACPTWPAGTSAACSHHAPAVLAFTNPTTNSYKRLVPGLRGAGQPRVLPAQPLGRGAHPALLEEPEGQAHRVPLPRPVVQPVPRLLGACSWPASTASRTASSRRPRSTRTSTTSPPRSSRKVPQVPGSLEEALDALEADHDFLKVGGVFTDDLIETWIATSASTRSTPSASAPTPGSSTSTTTS